MARARGAGACTGRRAACPGPMTSCWQRSVEVAKALIAGRRGQGCARRHPDDQPPGISRQRCSASRWRAASRSRSAPSPPRPSSSICCRHRRCRVLLFDRQVLKKDFGADARRAGAGDRRHAAPANSARQNFPSCVVWSRSTASTAESAIRRTGRRQRSRRWDGLSRAGHGTSPTARSRPRRHRRRRPTSAPSSSPRARPACPRASSTRSAPSPSSGGAGRGSDIDPVKHPVRGWTGNGFFWSGNISHGASACAGRPAARSSCSRVFEAEEALDADREGAGRLLQSAARINGRGSQASANWAQHRSQQPPLRHLWRQDLSSIRRSKTDWQMRPAFGTTETLTISTAVTGQYAARNTIATAMASRFPATSSRSSIPLTGEIVPRGERGEIGIKGADADARLYRQDARRDVRRGRLFLHRRRRLCRRGGLSLLGRPPDRHDQDRRRQCLAGRGR